MVTFNMQGASLLIVLLAAVAFVVIATSRWKVHPFIVLIVAAYGTALASGLPPLEVEALVREGFGSLMRHIGLIIIFGTLIGTLLEKTGAAITLAEAVLACVGKRFPGLAMSIIGYIVSIPVFCDSAFIILSSLKRSITLRTRSSPVMMSVALATGLFASHTLVPPTPGPIAAAGNLGLGDQLGLVIAVGLVLSIVPVTAGFLWASWLGRYTALTSQPASPSSDQDDIDRLSLPPLNKALLPIIVPLILIAAGSVAVYPGQPLGDGILFMVLKGLGTPLNALIIGFLLALRLLPAWNEVTLNSWMGDGLKAAANILLITGAGGAFGHILQATSVGDHLGKALAHYELGLLLPFIIAAAFKTSQGSSTVAMVATSALIAPLLTVLGLNSTIGMIFSMMAIGAGAMTISHANDSFFWVVAEFSEMDVKTAYRAFSLATLVQGLSTLVVILILGWILL